MTSLADRSLEIQAMGLRLWAPLTSKGQVLENEKLSWLLLSMLVLFRNVRIKNSFTLSWSMRSGGWGKSI